VLAVLGGALGYGPGRRAFSRVTAQVWTGMPYT